MKKNKSNNKTLVTVVLIVVAIILVVLGIKYLIYRQTHEFKLKSVGYLDNQITMITSKLDEKEINHLLTIEYSDQIDKFLQDKYFMFKNLENYIAYQKIEPSKSTRDIIATVNVGSTKEFYTDEKNTNMDIEDKFLILVNKFHKLDKNYKPDDVVPISLMYAYDDKSISQSIYSQFISLWKAANKEGFTLIVNSGFRDFELQEDLYNHFVNTKGLEEGELISARPGHSEHQLGLALDIASYGQELDESFENTKEFEWLKDHAHEYGFILRYPKDKTHLTGYAYEPWHYRYVGKEVAKYIYENDITFDEYYAYYIEK